MKRLLVTVDSLRYDHYKHMQKTRDFLGDSHEATFSTATATMGAFPQMFTGLYDANHDINDRKSWVEDIEQYSIGITSNRMLRADYGYSKGFGHYSDPISDGEDSLKDKIAERVPSGVPYRVAARALSLMQRVKPNVSKSFRPAKSIIEEFIDETEGRDEWFAWLHLNDVHHPYDPNRESRAKEQAVSRQAISTNQTDEEEYVRDLYRQEVEQVDNQLSHLWKYLDHDVQVVFTADHGEMLGESGIWGHPANCFDPAILRIPLAHNLDLNESPVRSFMDMCAMLTGKDWNESKVYREDAYASMTEIACVCNQNHIATENKVLTLDGTPSEDADLQRRLRGFRPSQITKSDGLEEDLRALGYVD